jgi:hypothetical protein
MTPRFNKLGASSLLVGRMNTLSDMVGKLEKTLPKEKKITEDKEAWSFAKMGSSGVMMSGSGMTIKMDGDEAGKLQLGLEAGDDVSVRSKGGKRFLFTAGKKGSYMVKEKDSDKHPDGVELSKDDVQSLLDLID